MSRLRYDIHRGVSKAKTRITMGIAALAVALGGGASLALVGAAHASSTVVVTHSNTQGWSSTAPLGDTRPGGAVSFNSDTTAPGTPANGALTLTTDATTAAKAQYMHAANTALADVTELSYSTKQNSASFAQGDSSYQLVACLGGVSGTTCNGFTTFVFEPYENTSQGVVVTGTWQTWDVDAGQMWSSKSVSAGGDCNVNAGFGGPPFYTLSQLQANCPDAVVTAFGVNIGSNNPSYDVEADLVNFNGTVYNFEPFAVVTDKDQCKQGGWQGLTDSNGNSFKNQGDCVSFTATKGKNKANG